MIQQDKTKNEKKFSSASKKNKITQAKSLTPPNSGINFVVQKKNNTKDTMLKSQMASQKNVISNSSTHNNKTAAPQLEKEIAKLFANELKSKNKQALNIFLKGLIDSISPTHIKIGDSPGKASYASNVLSHYTKSLAQLNELINLPAGNEKRKILGCKIVLLVTKSPLNIDKGDIAPKLPGKTKSTIKHKPLSASSPKNGLINAKVKRNEKVRTSSRLK